MTNLKQCPFCNGNAITRVSYDRVAAGTLELSAYIECKKCGVFKRIRFEGENKPFTAFEDAFTAAIEKWNERA